tara:strand:+ start:166 stop:417 length:252 start_codon:yes stop_codon:yes gene_type:complete
MKNSNLTEATLQRIVERVINEQAKEDAMKTLQSYFQQMQSASAEEKKELNTKIKELLQDNPNLKSLQGALTPKAQKIMESKKY